MIDFRADEERKPHVNLSALIDVAFILVTVSYTHLTLPTICSV